MTPYNFAQTLLKIDNISVSYDGRPILRDVNAEVKKIVQTSGAINGQVVGLLGPSGVGKTTLFRIIAGLSKPTSGKVEINGSDETVHAGEIGVVAQSYPLFEHRTVYSNLFLAARHDSNATEARERVVEFLHEFELADKSELYPAQLSGGQRQRVSIIQQILCKSHFLLMDEPFSGLDLLMLEKTCDLLNRIANRDQGLNTIIVVTHDVTTAASISDHLWLMGHETGC